MENSNNNNNNSEGKKTLGRRKIAIKKIENKTNLQVTFSKRRTGLFKKASEMSLLCDAEIALLVKSPANKIYAFGNPPDVESILNRFESQSPGPVQIPAYIDGLHRGSSRALLDEEDSKRKYDDVVRILEKEKNMENTMLKREDRDDRRWFSDDQFRNMEFNDLIEYSEALKELMANVERKKEEIEASKKISQHETATSSSFEDCSKKAFIGSKSNAWPDLMLDDDQNQKQGGEVSPEAFQYIEAETSKEKINALDANSQDVTKKVPTSDEADAWYLPLLNDYAAGSM